MPLSVIGVAFALLAAAHHKPHVVSCVLPIMREHEVAAMTRLIVHPTSHRSKRLAVYAMELFVLSALCVIVAAGVMQFR
jgi:hypothetical protein